MIFDLFRFKFEFCYFSLFIYQQKLLMYIDEFKIYKNIVSLYIFYRKDVFQKI